MEMFFKTPVLFLIFNRPETTARVFEAIRNIRPKHLYVAADGPRRDKAGEKELCEQARKIATAVDWDCDVKTLFRKDNLGCKNAIETAIDWFFENNERGIILEDDCLPHDDFFRFCEAMLAAYENVPEIAMISGSSFLKGKYTKKDDYYFSKCYDFWGWATWKKYWKLNKKTITDPPEEIFDKIFLHYGHRRYCGYLYTIIEQTGIGSLSSWGAIFQYYLLINGLLSLSPYKNLITNIGYTGTHNTQKTSPFLNVPAYELDINKLSIKKTIEADHEIDIKLMDIAIKGIEKANGKISGIDTLVRKFRDSYKYRKQLLKDSFHDSQH